MSTAKESVNEPVYERISRILGSPDTLVPVDDFALYYLLASEIARMAPGPLGESLILYLDEHTAMQVDAVDSTRLETRQIVVFGKPPVPWADAGNVRTIPWLTESLGHNLFIVAVSESFSMALVCANGNGPFRGGWTGDRDHVFRIVAELHRMGGMGEMPTRTIAGQHDRTMACAIRLMVLTTRQLTLRQMDIAADKNDLHSVLEILKAVSAKRRSHDILYVFVEQIARAVKMDRCSVVRVWGGNATAHVLASHEDETVSNLPIDLARYPEIRRTLETRQKVVVNDTRHDPLMRSCADDIAQAGVHSLIVIPVLLFDPVIGSFLLRAARTKDPFSLREISFCEIVAEAAANALERAHLFEGIQKANERLEYLAITDGLTGIYNHRYFRQRLEDEFERARRYNLPLSCLIMDIDGFKKVNDTFGHLQGDKILRTIATCTLQLVRKSDVVARYGGEEFVVIMPQTGLDGARVEAERIRKMIEDTRHEGLPSDHPVTVSVGVAIYDPDTMLDCEALIRVADSALYRAKREGKNRVVIGNLEGAES
ncbi:MAG TPA: sensor domain-containing diguanylate cyclase [Candidatus Hydrogenedentes bacterium]|nr:sensor domain-containing diguanylate cyclase [Candidatus Hydrogenedentota bacterium]HOV72509.1 sensor domain-containing diguanylate cyclase [Candidatus Hydrogenedentota bacterium]HPC15327.1 sensor domain-containing diguanylate cyclase [Candidatus Hydrogenedentota bacterium]HRT19282.1 sensor domain-containing diguanylate cyclase [Candidatus Hydrogenedentota bacterium]HRT63362.1 sensor domain-containing diguanylate cyclase [Candidatus Hydrogenedentota bacterium]